jgi:hypothetical protein
VNKALLLLLLLLLLLQHAARTWRGALVRNTLADGVTPPFVLLSPAVSIHIHSFIRIVVAAAAALLHSTSRPLADSHRAATAAATAAKSPQPSTPRLRQRCVVVVVG